MTCSRPTWLMVSLGLLLGIAGPAFAAPLDEGPRPASPAPLHAMAHPSAYYHFVLAYQLDLANSPDAALQEYEKALSYDPFSAVLHLRVAGLHQAKGEHGKAQAHAEQVLAREGANVQALQVLAASAMATGQSDRAIGHLQRIITLRPQEGHAYFSLGMVYAGLKRYEEAEQIIRRGIESAPSSGQTGYLYWGRVLVEQKAWARAAQAYREAITANPSFEQGYLGLGAALEAQGETAEAVGVYKTLLGEVNQGNREARQRLVRVLLAEKAYDQALAFLNEVVTEFPDDVEAQLRIGLIYGELKDYPKAVQQIKNVLSIRPKELRVRDHLAYLYEEMKDYEQAIREYEAIIQADDQYSDAHLHLGYLLYRLKRGEEALPYFRRVVTLNPKMTEAYLMLGLTLLQATRYDDAVETFKEGLVRNPDSADLHFNLGTTYDKMGRLDELIFEMEEAIRLDPKHADALNYLGYTYAERDMHLGEAVVLIQKALEIKPRNGYYLDSLAWAYFKLGRYQEALEEMKRAVEVVPDDPIFFEHLGDIYLTHNLLSQAREAWMRSLELDPKNRKLLDRFKGKGFGDPNTEERIRKAQQRIS